MEKSLNLAESDLELIEAAYWMKYYQNRSKLKTYATHISGAFAGAMPELDILAMNRVIGLGTGGAISEESLNQCIQFYKNAGSKRFFIQIAPSYLDQNALELLNEQGFRHYNYWSKLVRNDDDFLLTTNPLLNVRHIQKSEASLYGDLIFQSFDWEENRISEWLASAVGLDGYTHYIISYQGIDIGAGALFVQGKMASMALAGILPMYRGLGAQRLLLKTRINDAIKLGVKTFTLETGQHSIDKPVKSYENAIKVGFDLAYLRANWIYELDD